MCTCQSIINPVDVFQGSHVMRLNVLMLWCDTMNTYLATRQNREAPSKSSVVSECSFVQLRSCCFTRRGDITCSCSSLCTSQYKLPIQQQRGQMSKKQSNVAPWKGFLVLGLQWARWDIFVNINSFMENHQDTELHPTPIQSTMYIHVDVILNFEV